MNTTLKTTLALGAAGLSLLSLAGAASAQTTVGDSSLTNIYSTLRTGAVPTNTIGSLPVGYDPSFGVSIDATTPATAQSVYDAFTFDSSAAGTFNTVTAGTVAQLELFSINHSNTIAPTFDVYASLYAYDPAAAAAGGSVPALGPNLFGSEQKVTIGEIGGYYSADFNLAAPLIAGNTYVLGVTTLTGTPQDFASVATSPYSKDGLSSADNAISHNKYFTDSNDQGNPTGATFGGDLTSGNVMAFRLDTAPAAVTNPVPEASSVVSLGLLLGLGAAAFAFKRRRTVTN